MKIDLMDLFNDELQDMHIDTVLASESLVIRDEKVNIKDGVKIILDITLLDDNQLLLEGVIDTIIKLNCDRCNDNVDYSMKIDFSKEVKIDDDTSREEYEDIIDSKYLYLEKFVFDEIYLNYPMKVLCNDDCKGICKQCGVNLNKEQCSCEDDNIDPRLLGLKALFNENFKEV